ncbi:MAG: Wzz/FepE/Etk N-terminal domain-containing protein [Terracidiphilus sp.]
MGQTMVEQDSTLSRSLTVTEDPAATPNGGIRQEITLLEFLTELARRKVLIVRVVIVATVIGIVLSLFLPVRYTAITHIMPPQQTQSSASLFMSQLAGNGAGPLAALASGGLDLKSPNDLYVGLLESPTIADAIIHRFDLVHVYGSPDMTGAREKLAQSTLVKSEKSGLITIAVTDREKQRAATLANAYTSELRALTQSLAVTEASQRRLFYEDQLKQAKEALVAAELQFQQVQQQKGLVALDAQAKAMIESLAALRAQAAAKQVEVQALRSYSTEQNPEVQLAEQELSTLQAEEAHMAQSGHSPGLANLGLEDVPSASLEYLRAQHELVYRQTLYDLLIKQYDAARLDEAKEAAIIQVVDPATEPERKSAPHRVWIALAAMFLGLFGSITYILACAALERARRDPQTNAQLLTFKAAMLMEKTSKRAIQ